MRRIGLLGLMLFASAACGQYRGSWKIDDPLTLYTTTSSPTTGQAINTATPEYFVYENITGTPILNGLFARLDTTNTNGFWAVQITLSAANGFEKGKCYAAYYSASISSASYPGLVTWQIEAEVDANIVSDKIEYHVSSFATDAITAAAIQASAIGASELATDSITNDEIAASAVTEIQSGLATAANLAIANASLELIELADINGTVDTALADYDPPTRAELTSDINSLNDLSSAQVAALIAAGTADILAVSDEFGSGGGASAGAIADAVWDEAAADHNSAGTMGNKMNNAASAGDPWSTALPGAYGTGTAGEMLNLIWTWVRSN